MSLAALEAHLAADLTACTDGDLGCFARLARSGIAQLEGFLTRLAAEARRREAAGAGVVADEVIRGDGEISRDRVDAVSARASVADTLPSMGEAIGTGEARPENADAVASLLGQLSPTERERLAAHDDDLTRRAATDSPETFARHLKAKAKEVRHRPDHQGQSRAERDKARSHLGMGRRPNGLWWIGGELAAEWGAPINDRLRARARTLAGDGPITPNHMAQALFDLVTGMPGSDVGSAGGPLGHHRMGIGYIIDASTLFGPADHGTDPGAPGGRSSGPAAGVAETWGGEPVDPAMVRRLACDCDLYAILIGAGGEPRGARRTHRSADREQRLQLRALYPTCPLDGTTPFERCEIHHVNLAHGEGGSTVLANLVPISSKWHHRIHDLGWQLTMLPDRTLELRTPDGLLHAIISPPTPITRQRE